MVKYFALCLHCISTSQIYKGVHDGEGLQRIGVIMHNIICSSSPCIPSDHLMIRDHLYRIASKKAKEEAVLLLTVAPDNL